MKQLWAQVRVLNRLWLFLELTQLSLHAFYARYIGRVHGATRRLRIEDAAWAV